LRNDLGIFLGETIGSVNGGLVYEPGKDRIVARSNLTLLSIKEQDFHRYRSSKDDIKDSLVRNQQRLDAFIPKGIPKDTMEDMNISDEENVPLFEAGPITSKTIDYNAFKPTNETTEVHNMKSKLPNRKTRRAAQRLIKSTIGKKAAKGIVGRIITRSHTRVAALLTNVVQNKTNELTSATCIIK